METPSDKANSETIPTGIIKDSARTKDYDLFVSYSHQDYPKVQQILRALANNGIMFFDPLAHQPEMWGRDLKNWFKDVFPARTRAAMVFFSKSYNQSQWCTRELEYVLRSAKESSALIQLLPLRLDKDEVPPMARDVVFLDVADTSPERIATLTKSRLEDLEEETKRDFAILSDEELLKKVAAERDEEAFEVLYKRNFPTIVRYISNYSAAGGRKEDDPAEIASNVLVKVWEQASRFTDEASSFERWLRSLTNRTISEYERGEELDNSRAASSSEGVPDPILPLLDTHPPGVLEALRVDELISGFSAKEREVFSLYSQGMSFREIAEVLDMSPAASRMIFYRLLSRLRRKVDPQESAQRG